MRKIVCFLALMFVSFLPRTSSAQQTKPLAYLLFQADDGDIAAAVTDSAQDGDKPREIRNLNIVCDRKPCRIHDYIERVYEYPLGLFRLSDLEDNLITTWVAGSAYVVRIYNIRSPNVIKVLDVHSIRSPEVFVSKNGYTKVRVFVRASEKSNIVRSVIWSWNGKVFLPMKSAR
jgi:hypothetical protein